MKAFTIKFKKNFKRRAVVKPTKVIKSKKAYSRKKKYEIDRE